MGRVMDRVANNPVRIDVGPIERHHRAPLVGRKLRESREQCRHFSFNADQRGVDAQQKSHSKEDLSHMVCILSGGPLAIRGSAEQIVSTESGDSVGEPGRQDFDGRDGCGIGIAPLLAFESALVTPFKIHNAVILPAVSTSGMESLLRLVLGGAEVSTTRRAGTSRMRIHQRASSRAADQRQRFFGQLRTENPIGGPILGQRTVPYYVGDLPP